MKAEFSAADQRFMRRALELAERGRGTTRPNPTVGAVIVRGGRIVGQGFHERAGGPHAEVAALANLRGDPRGTTLYVTLEPCCHTGRTGPCTEALVKARVARVVVGCRDPNPIVNGRGIARLRRAGIRVDVGCLEPEARAAIRGYATWIAERRPLVTLKAAATLDGYIADAHPRSRRAPAFLTGAEARRVAHELRAAHDAVLVGAGTARADDPRLTVRLPGRPATGGPLRVLLAGKHPVPPKLKMLRGHPPSEIVHMGDRADLRKVLTYLAREREVQSLLVEGGATVHGAFIAAGLVDRVVLFVAPRLIGGGVPVARGADRPLAKALRLGRLSTRAVGADLLITADVLR
ncbi:MAG TPA: bifunctional diaminohydroxyphosphoribosylaminopyrimidine deaminase/5-amino-6-(5-phosphoribosylamino)uracil reductase RibD [Polyangia bacterium]|nr:bifunctional diaminohydroxyphosphoribosylaminopyrimidine deaminase/5-amino-6-(5-phosphoribosylamino)uracil reductase RibD [Polyangia bacterium]